MPQRENTKLDKILTLSVSTSWIKLIKSLSLYIMHVIWSSKTQYMYTKRQLTYSTKRKQRHTIISFNKTQWWDLLTYISFPLIYAWEESKRYVTRSHALEVRLLICRLSNLIYPKFRAFSTVFREPLHLPRVRENGLGSNDDLWRFVCHASRP